MSLDSSKRTESDYLRADRETIARLQARIRSTTPNEQSRSEGAQEDRVAWLDQKQDASRSRAA